MSATTSDHDDAGQALAYEEAARAARTALYSTPRPGAEILETLARRAQALAPDDVTRAHWSRIITAISSPGHRFKTSVFPAVVSVDPDVPVELLADLESAFVQGGTD